MARQELARFLRDRRAALRPARVGLHDGHRPPHTGPAPRGGGGAGPHVGRLLHAAGTGPGPRPSPRILDALAGALRLTPAERSHLFRLAGSSRAARPSAVRRVRPHVARMLRRLPETGAIVTDAAYDVVAWNPLAQALLGADLGRGTTNLARRRFLGRGACTRAPAPRNSGTSWSRGCAGPPTATRTTSCSPPAGRTARRQRGVPADLGHHPGPRSRAPHQDHEPPEAGRLRLNCDVLVSRR